MGREIQSMDFVDDSDEVLDFMKIRLGPLQLENVAADDFIPKAEMSKFMEEPVVIRIHADNDPNSPPSVYVAENGVGGWIPRERNIKVPRRYIEVLARSVATTYRTRKNPDPDADDGTMVLRRSAQEYPFEIIRDENPKGREWLKRLTGRV